MGYKLFGTLLKSPLSLTRASSTLPSPKVLQRLTTRSLISVKGPESSDFLQGLITNDMRHFSEGIPNIYSLFLNTKGRVLYDVIIYKSPEQDTFLVEVDKSISPDLQRHLKMYKIRRKIDITPLDDSMRIWAAFAPDFDGKNMEKLKFDGRIFPCGSLTGLTDTSKSIDDVMIFKDPRTPFLGLRILTLGDVPKSEISGKLGLQEHDDGGEMNYKKLRYVLGVGEGVDDLPPGKAFPLEINCDYLHGVSFHKGCYIGQELTARTHHTGVVRKRLMPLISDEEIVAKFDYDEKICDENGKVVGKFRGAVGRCCLGLMRISEALGATELRIQGSCLKVVKPCWWPVDSPQEKISVN